MPGLFRQGFDEESSQTVARFDGRSVPQSDPQLRRDVRSQLGQLVRHHLADCRFFVRQLADAPNRVMRLAITASLSR